jgi:pyruvate/2-oxoacid:ferredoxin oxidoreductase beta subunit
MATDGLGFVEVLSPCPEGFGKPNGFPEGLDMMEYFEEHCVVDSTADVRDVGVELDDEPIVLGNFVEDEESRSYMSAKTEYLENAGVTGGEDE